MSMHLHLALVVGLLISSSSSALKFPVRRSSTRSALNSRSTHGVFSPFKVTAVVSDDNSLDLSTRHDLLYMANITLGGNDYPVQFDTGSSDLWIKGSTTPLPNSSQTKLTTNLTYGIGSAFGIVSYAHVEFAGITVERQAYLDVSSAKNPALNYGAQGILGLGFTALSTIDSLVNNTGSSDGRSLLFNLFEDNPSEPNYIAFALQRSIQPDDDVVGSFTIGEVEEKYKAVLDRPKIPTWPVHAPKRWNVLIESLIVGTKHVTPTTEVANVPSNRAVALLDSGTSFTYAPKAIVDEIYGNIPGAIYSPSANQWTVPCDAEIDMALQINGQIYPLHPLDAIPKGLVTQDGCIGSWVPQPVAIGAGQFDWLIGDNVLRSMYSIYDFGDFDANNNMGDPYVKALSLTDPNEASAEFVALRGGTAKKDITYNVGNNDSSDPNSTAVTLSADVANSLNNISKYFPIMLAVVGLNALVILLALIFGMVYLCRRRKSKRAANRVRTPMARMSPMPVSGRNSYIAGATTAEPHTYEPVSMAITEDTLAAPMPGFRNFAGKPGDRPHSLAGLPSQSKLYQKIGSEDALFSPPSPNFNGRPTSVASLPVTGIYSPPPKPVDQPFIAPAISPNDDQASIHSRHSTASRANPASASVDTLPLAPDNGPPSPTPSQRARNQPSPIPDTRPKSILVNAQRPMSHIVDDTPPSTAFFSPTGSPNGPPNGATQAPAYPPASAGAGNPTFRPPQRSHLRPSALGLGAADRPMSVGILPSQRFEPPSPTTPRSGSNLRPLLANANAERPMSVTGLPSHHKAFSPREEDITTFNPPQPAFRRAGSSSNERPSSMA